jgi:hypothetical protein
MGTVTYKYQPGTARVLKQGTPLVGTSHIYLVDRVLWPEEVEKVIADDLLLSPCLHVCCGKSLLGDVRLDAFEPDVDIRADGARLPFRDRAFASVLCDPPYNGRMQWNHDLLKELARVADQRIIFQHWFMPVDPHGRYKKLHAFTLRAVLIWQPRTYFGRVQVISVLQREDAT